MSTYRKKSDVRSASLVNRYTLDPVPRTAWVLAWGLFAAAVFLVVRAADTVFGVMQLAGLVVWPASALGARSFLAEPEPLPASPTDELLAALATRRNHGVWMLFGSGFGFTLFLVLSTLAPGTWLGLAAFVTGLILFVFQVRLASRMRADVRRIRQLRVEHGSHE